MSFLPVLSRRSLHEAFGLRALRRLYRRRRVGGSAEARGDRLLRRWLSVEQQEQLNRFGSFEVVGCSTGRRYRVYYGTSCNVHELDAAGRPKRGLCFIPRGQLVSGDVVLAQKIALETDELTALDVANEFLPTSLRTYPCWTC